MHDNKEHDGQPAFHRPCTRHDSGTTELRIDIPTDLMAGIDALMLADKHKTRADFLVPILRRELKNEVHRANVLLRCLHINPLDPEATGGNP